MVQVLDHFNQNLGRARALCAIAKRLETVVTGVVDLTDIYRASLVLGVSALDYFVHEFVRTGMLEAHHGKRQITNSHKNFKVTLETARLAISEQPDAWLDDAVREAHSWQSFQRPDKIAEAIRLVSAKDLWKEVAIDLGKSSDQIKREIKLIADRRDKIAHEADLDPDGFPWPISDQLVSNALNTLESVVRSIAKVAT